MRLQGEKEWRAALMEETARLSAEEELELDRFLSSTEYRNRDRIQRWRDRYREHLMPKADPPQCSVSVLDRLRERGWVRKYLPFLRSS